MAVCLAGAALLSFSAATASAAPALPSTTATGTFIPAQGVTAHSWVRLGSRPVPEAQAVGDMNEQRTASGLPPVTIATQDPDACAPYLDFGFQTTGFQSEGGFAPGHMLRSFSALTTPWWAYPDITSTIMSPWAVQLAFKQFSRRHSFKNECLTAFIDSGQSLANQFYSYPGPGSTVAQPCELPQAPTGANWPRSYPDGGQPYTGQVIALWSTDSGAELRSVVLTGPDGSLATSIEQPSQDTGNHSGATYVTPPPLRAGATYSVVATWQTSAGVAVQRFSFTTVGVRDVLDGGCLRSLEEHFAVAIRAHDIELTVAQPHGQTIILDVQQGFWGCYDQTGSCRPLQRFWAARVQRRRLVVHHRHLFIPLPAPLPGYRDLYVTATPESYVANGMRWNSNTIIASTGD